MKITTVLLISMVTINSCASQQMKKSELVLFLEENIGHVEFSKLSFFSKELIELATDTSFQFKFMKALRKTDEISRKTKGDQREYELTLFVLYRNLSNEENYDKRYQKGKDFFLNILKERSSINLPIDENLVIQQVDGANRGLIDGYDEGSISESRFIFFCYDPLLYKNALLSSKLSNSWQRTGVFLCNYLRANGNPNVMRGPIREAIIDMLGHKETKGEFEDVVSGLANCEIYSNLYD